MVRKGEIPFGAQFSPNQVDLPKLLRIIQDHASNRTHITEAIRSEFFAAHSSDQQLKLADNTVLALRAYELLDEDYATPTKLMTELLAIAIKPDALYERFAKHILTNHCIKLTLSALPAYLVSTWMQLTI